MACRRVRFAAPYRHLAAGPPFRMQPFFRYTCLIASWCLLVASVIGGLFGACLTIAMLTVWREEGRLLTGDFRGLRIGLAISGTSLALGFLAFRSIRRIRPQALRSRVSKTGIAERRLRRLGAIALAIDLALLILLNTPGSRTYKVSAALAAVIALWIGKQIFFLFHELGHLGSAWLGGLELYKMQVGVGPVLWRHETARGLLWEWRFFAGGGMTISWWPEERMSRWKMCLYVGGGLAVSFIFTAGAGLYLQQLAADSGPYPFQNPVFVFAVIYSAWAALITVGNSIPHYVRVGSTRLPSDGLHILRQFCRPKAPEAEARVARFLVRVLHLWHDRRYERAWTELRDGFPRYPEAAGRLHLCAGALALDDGAPKAAIVSLESALAANEMPADLKLEARALLACGLAAIGEIDRARPLMAAVLAEVEPKKKPHFLDTFASITWVHGVPDLLPDAIRWCEEARQLQPKAFEYQALETALWVEKGAFEKAEPLLRALLRGGASEALRAFVAFYLALLLVRRGGPVREIARLRRQALEGCGRRALLRRIETELPDPAARKAADAASGVPDRA
jgi:tetratricopeptide (TPR) repeat protein